MLSLADVLGLYRPAWHAHAACRGEDTARWFPGQGADRSYAYAVCESCPVRAQCLTDALDSGQRYPTYGIWGGTSAKQRRRLRDAEQRRAA